MSSGAFEVERDGSASPLAVPRLRLNVVCPYYTMFPLSFPMAALRTAAPSSSVLDPFCGRGTTTYAARLLGLTSLGVDTDDVAVAIARAKLSSDTAEAIEGRVAELLAAVPTAEDVPAGEFWELAFERETLLEICRVRQALFAAGANADVALRAILLGILHGPQSVAAPNYLSNQMPRTYATKPRPAITYWKRTGFRPRRVDLREAVARRARYLMRDVPAPVRGRIIQADSRKLSELGVRERFDVVVTSPPYLGMRSYRPDQWLRHWFLGGPPDVDYELVDSLPPSLATFSTELRKVWVAAAAHCKPSASLTVRFGALPSVRSNPEQVLRASLEGTGWKVENVISAGSASAGKRQAGHMNHTGDPAEEIDLRARLAA